jgi:3-dehydrotetronate 4-kinase
MLLGVIADDFTGASDVANTIAKSGMSTTQYFNIPTDTSPAANEVGVISLKSRSTPANDAVLQSLKALEWLLQQGCEQIVFKYCSTFDSTPRGNIGPVAEALADRLGVSGVVACPAFPDAGRTVYQGNLFVHDQPLNESGLENHPLNPMIDSDIRRWLQKQTKTKVGHVPWQTVLRGEGLIRESLVQASASGEKLVIVDAITNNDLIAIGKACSGAKLITGASGVALGLGANFSSLGKISATNPKWAGISGAEAILAGSCSNATRGQIEHHKKKYPVMAVDALSIIQGSIKPQDVVQFILSETNNSPLVYSSATPAEVKKLQYSFGLEQASHAIEQFFANSAKALEKSGVRRLVVAGGETSGAVVSALGIEAVDIGPEIDPGVPALLSKGKFPIALALKSGNFGSEDFFAKSLRKLAGES